MKSTHVRFSPEWWAWMTEREPNSGCHLWLGTVCASGYGRVAYGRAGSPVLIHRIAYELAFGAFDRTLKVCHRCDTPSCVNPDHLFLGTQQDNMRDMFEKGRANPRGHRGQRRLATVAATVATRELASENSHASDAIAYKLHLTRTSALLARWRHVTGVPPLAPGHDGPSCKWPQIGTDNLASAEGAVTDRRDTGALLSGSASRRSQGMGAER